MLIIVLPIFLITITCMIQITDKHNCCGCSACVQICPKQCISFDEDNKGFCYPKVNVDNCFNCGLCEKACPCLNQDESQKPLKVYAAINPDEKIRSESSSGGVFTMLAEAIIAEGGVVFGARFDEKWEVIHDYTETKEGLEAFRCSKYVQSKIGRTYIQAQTFLNAGRKVLYTGTSCQIAGLKRFLRKEYDNLLTVDVVCHGVPSPLVWRNYLKTLTERPTEVVGNKTGWSLLKERPVISHISFRDKLNGWKKFGFVVRGKTDCKAQEEILLHETIDDNLFMKLFMCNLVLRPSCFNCSAKAGKSGSDITIADYWGIEDVHPEFFDDKGASAVIINSAKGQAYIKKLNLRLLNSEYDNILRYNPSLEHSVEETQDVERFWRVFEKKGIGASIRIVNPPAPGFLRRAYYYIRRHLN